MREPRWTATDTIVTVNGPDFTWAFDAHRELLEWLERHGINPRDVPADCTIERDVEARCVRFPLAICGHVADGELCACWGMSEPGVVQLEAPPMPFPALILAGDREATS